MMYKNWSEICTIDNPWLRMLVATTDDVTILEGLQRGFPELFSEKEVRLKVPLSALAERIKNEDARYCDPILEEFNLPNFIFSDDHVGAVGTMPEEWRGIIRTIDSDYDICKTGQRHLVTWEGEECIVFEFSLLEPPDESRYWLTIVPTRFIDFNS